jgi:hypothetical protein
MATKDERPGLLSKVAMFVRNPTKDWSELDQPEQQPEAGYDKQALKAMIERKRQNDFVRKREFDQLRKLRNRDPGAIASMARPSFFQTSMPTDPDGRAITLKKIDEIEAQMSKQWWKGKQEAASSALDATGATIHAAGTTIPGVGTENIGMSTSTLPTQSASIGQDLFEPTEANELKKGESNTHASEFIATQMANGMVVNTPDHRASVESNASAAGFSHTNVGFSTSRLFAIDNDEMATDPELEEAAIRFANGDDATAAQGLLAALRGQQLEPEAAQSWAAALLDLYRATGARAEFESASLEFALQMDAATPAWTDLRNTMQPVQSLSSSSDHAVKPTWTSPENINLAAMESLRDAMATHPMPWHIDWEQLRAIEPDAMALLDGLFASLCEEPVEIRFTGGDQVARALRALTPPGDRGVATVWWQTRLNALRTMRMQDEFEMAALNYCVTHEVPPMGWVEATCRFTSVALGATDPTTNAQFVEMPALRGEMIGDVSRALADLEAFETPGLKLVVHCGNLLRVDFAAAGSILNWVALRQAQGKIVQFQQVHRLVAAFFNVIGINEHAKVIPRAI